MENDILETRMGQATGRAAVHGATPAVGRATRTPPATTTVRTGRGQVSMVGLRNRARAVVPTATEAGSHTVLVESLRVPDTSTRRRAVGFPKGVKADSDIASEHRMPTTLVA